MCADRRSRWSVRIQTLVLVALISGSVAPAFANDFRSEKETAAIYRSDKTGWVGENVVLRNQLDPKFHFPYTAERQAIQDRIIAEASKGGVKTKTPRVIFIEGAIGSGKTTSLEKLARAGYIDLKNSLIIDPDRFKSAIPEFPFLLKKYPEMAATYVHRESSTLAELTLRKALQDGKNIIFDANLSDGEYFTRLFQEIRKTVPGSKIEIISVNARKDLVKERVLERGKKTGRHVPPEKVDLALSKKPGGFQLAQQSDRVLVIDNNERTILRSIENPYQKTLLFADLDNPVIKTKISSRVEDFYYRPQPKPQKFNDVVFDIDWTIADSPQGVPVQSSRLRIIQGESYRVVDNAEELIHFLATQPDARVSFYSAGTQDRNIKYLKSLILKDGRTAYDVAYKVLSKQHLVAIPEKDWPPNAKFADKFKKDVTLVSDDLQRVILVEDIAKFAYQPGQTLYVGDTYLPHESFLNSRVTQISDELRKWNPKTYWEWYLSQYRLYGVQEILEQALIETRKTGRPFVEIVNELQSKDRAFLIRRKMLERGLAPCSTIEMDVRSLFSSH